MEKNDNTMHNLNPEMKPFCIATRKDICAAVLEYLGYVASIPRGKKTSHQRILKEKNW